MTDEPVQIDENALATGAESAPAEPAQLADPTPAQAPEPTGEGQAEPQPQDQQPKSHWAHKRIDQLTRKLHEERRERENAQTALEETLRRVATGEPAPQTPATPQPQLSDAEIDRRADQKILVQNFNNACNKVAETGKAEFKDFDEAVGTLRAFGALDMRNSPGFLPSVVELDNAHKVLYHLGTNPEEAERIMSLPQTKMTIELAKLDAKLAKPAAAAPVSKAPSPVTPIGGSAKPAFDPDDPSLSYADWKVWREKTKKVR